MVQPTGSALIAPPPVPDREPSRATGMKAPHARRGILALALALALLPATGSAETKPSWVLINGLTNIHQWSDSFVAEAARQLGGGKLVVVPTNASGELSTRTVEGQTITYCGRDAPFDAGIASLEWQSQAVAQKLRGLHQRGLLTGPISVIGHSMGGLVARRVAELLATERGVKIERIVTVGTPHHGSPLADLPVVSQALGRLLGAWPAVADLRPEAVASFNRKNPVRRSPAAIYTIRGCSHGLMIGALGECHVGHEVMELLHRTGSDGLVPTASARIDGARHLASFDGKTHSVAGVRTRLPLLDHYGLVRDPTVVRVIARALKIK